MNEIQIIRVTEDHEFDPVFDIRTRVFVEEQNVPYEEEMDGLDHISHHYLAVYQGKAVGTCRWRITMNGEVKLERFAVLEAYRGKKVGQALVQACLKDVPHTRKIYLHAQVQVTGFYKKLGFDEEGEIFDEAGIQHVKMVYHAKES